MLKLTFLIHCILTLCSAQSSDENIDTFEPIVRTSPEMGQFDGDYFGYTAVLHKIRQNGGMDDVRIVVSAPYGQANNSALERVISDTTNLLATGVIYTCMLTPSECVGLTGDGEGADERLYDVERNAIVSIISDGNQGEQKRGQFLGATLKSTGETFLACAHRRLDYGVGLDRNPYGVCYFSGRTLEGFSRYEPCSTSSRSFFGHGQCQAGTSGDIINGDILVGAPGTFAWRGAVFRRSSNGQRRTGSDNGVGTGSISWQGYDVVTGRISSSNLDFIVSVPRFNNYRGRVNIYANQNTLTPVGNPPLAGDQVGEYYGFSLAAADMQSQGMDDLLVGAPLHSSTSTPEVGRVYVYRNDRGALSRYTVLEGSILYGRFGHAMARLGDINGDNYEDVAISAPFGVDSGGEALPGTVYIYAGAGADVIRQTPIQVIVGNRLNLNPRPVDLSSFGASLSSNVDVDNNGYNDLVIGAFRSQRVYVLRTRPVARVQVNIMTDSEVDLTVTPCSGKPCFNISVCLTYEAGRQGAQQSSSVNVNYTLQVDPQLIQAGLPSRVDLLMMNGQSSGSTSTISGDITLMQGVGKECINATAVVTVDQPDITITSPFTVQFIPTIVDTRENDSSWDGNMRVNSLESAPVLFTIGDTVAVVQYITNCDGNTCRPNLRVVVVENGIQYENNDGNTVTTMGILSGVVTSLEIPVMVENNGDDAFGARITVTYNPALIFSRAAPENERTITLTCITTRGVDNSTAECLIENRFLANASRVLIFRFQTGSITGTEGDLLTTFVVTSQPSENRTTFDDNTAMVTIATDTNADLMIQVESQESFVVGQTNPLRITDVAQFAPISSVFDMTFPVSNLGPTRIPSAQVSIFWPLRTPSDDNNNYYLYPIQVDNGNCESTYINIEGHGLDGLGEINTQSGKRKRRQAAPVTNATLVSCADGVSESCVEIICNVTVPSLNGPLRIQAIPDNREFFGTTQNWEFTIFAEVEILGLEDEDESNNNVSFTIVGVASIAPPSSEDDEIAAWVIIVPIVVGVLVIIVIVVCLYFLGFFKLKKVEKDKDEVELNQDDAPDGEKPEASEL